MRCKYCGGEINLSVGRCISCGLSVDATSDIRILHDLGSIAEQYGLDPDQEKYDQPIQKEKQEARTVDQRTEVQHLPPDLRQAKKPGIQLSTYYELLGDRPEDEKDTSATADPQDTTAEEAAAADDGKAMTVPDASVEAAGQNVTPEPDADISGAEDARTEADDDAESDDDTQPDTGGLRARISELLDRTDQLTAPVTERIRQWYNSKMPQMHRAQSSSKWERLAVMGALLAAVLIVIVLVSLIISSIPASVSGEWRISEENSPSILTVEFSNGRVIARVYDESGEPHIYKEGEYKTSRSSGHDLLTIVYDDGTLSNLYYELNGKTGEFVNVGTGASSTYRRVD